MTSIHKFPLISGNISLDLVNTEIVRHGTRHDLLSQREHVIAWFYTLIENNIFYAEQFEENIQQWADRSLPLLLEMRSLLRENFEGIADGQEVSTRLIAYLQQCIKQAPFTFQLAANTLLPSPIGKPEHGLLSFIALDVLKLISSNDIKFIKRCANPTCVLLFIDTRGRRKWCSMKICGNREKVNRYQRDTK